MAPMAVMPDYFQYMAPVYSSAFAPSTTSEIGAMGAMVPAYFSMTHENP